MTQEELDALMAGGLDDFEESSTKTDEKIEPEPKEEKVEIKEEKKSDDQDIKNYRVNSSGTWPPPPPTEDHKMVHQLDDITRDSEMKVNEVFDKLEAINSILMDLEDVISSANELMDKQNSLLTTLKENFPNVKRFDEALKDMETLTQKTEEVVSHSQMAQDEIMMTMDIMQYQDIHRQKIERVINVMRALSKYMNSLFEGKIDDEKRVSSAVHIEGDSTTEDVVSNEDIEALIATLGK